MKEGFSTGTLREVFSVNFFGALKWVELFNGKFLDRGHGKFIAISSIFAERPDIDSVAYCSSKSALSMAFRSLHLHFCRNAIDFVTIHFGPVYTGISSEYRGNAISRKKAFFIISPEAAANFIIKAMREKRSRRYFPSFTTMPIRMVFFLNDKVFYGISRVFRR
jgi:short-subunit dehydrogenase